MTNKEKFTHHLELAYMHLFEADPEYSYSASRITPKALAEKMSNGLITGDANKDGDGVKRACKACGIKQTYQAISEYLKS